MPASRSRTERWRETLEQIQARGGGLEFSVEQRGDTAGVKSPDLMWRSRVYSVSDREIVLERPAAVGKVFEFAPGTSVVAIIAVGQNRWMFRSTILGAAAGRPGATVPFSSMRIAMPESVERCQRRDSFRTPTATLQLPEAECWPLRDPTSVVAAEVANRAMIAAAEAIGQAPVLGELTLPDVGPSFKARLMNIGGGGIGLQVPKSEVASTGRSPLLWIRVDLRPSVAAPLGFTTRIAHTHIDHEQNIYLGLAFDFSFNAGHKEFVCRQLERCVADLMGPSRRKAA